MTEAILIIIATILIAIFLLVLELGSKRPKPIDLGYLGLTVKSDAKDVTPDLRYEFYTVDNVVHVIDNELGSVNIYNESYELYPERDNPS